ncbi:collagen-like protein [Arenibacter algicola]|uniref:Dihydrolipoamide dehydrogenase n=1 Tax=Arenibacter algicola TaxID=616991 RepID=A0A221URM2_9FLAO|nr:collagen-like protein [Arenibacter algicola]ASO03994.1 dihydrolipoamide dehydrogenase [Arenibacter algicola]
MKTAIKSLSLVIVLVALTFTSCTKEGETGPMGPAGINGTDGTDGEDGNDGNANVMASDWLEPTESSYSVNNPRYKALPLATNLGSSLLEDGVILVYYDNDTDVYLLPNHIFAPDGTILKSIDSKINRASRNIYVNIQRSDSDLTPGEYLWDPSGPPYGKGVRFRYVIVPSNAASGKKAAIDYKKMSYEEVMDHFGLDY